MSSEVRSLPNQRWIISPRIDLSVFIGAPLILIPVSLLAPLLLPWGIIKIIVMTISANGHHLPGFIRAYTDPAVFRNFRHRLVIVPALFISLAIVAAWFKLTFIFLLLMIWGVWHGGMQILGFLRIYDLKAGFRSLWTARLDFWICFVWLVQVILWSDPKKTSILSYYYMAGGPQISRSALRAFETGWLVASIVITVAWLALLAYNRIKKNYFNPAKFFCVILSMVFWYYCMVSVNDLLIGVILWEVFHDLQYNVFVWGYNQNRVNRNLSLSSIERFIFRSEWKPILLYILCILAYGSIGLISQDTVRIYDNQPFFSSLASQIGSVFVASALCHFYMDGFIWRVRDGKVQRDLGINTKAEFRKSSELKHWMGIGLVVLFCAYLGHAEYSQKNRPENKREDNLAELVPASGYANFLKASLLNKRGEFDSAIIYYERAINYDKNYSIAHDLLGDLKFKQGNIRGSVYHFEKSLSQDSGNSWARENLAELYLQIALGYLQDKDGLRAKPYLEKSLKLDSVNASVWNYLGMVEHASGNLPDGLKYYRKSLTLDSKDSLTKVNLEKLIREMPSPD